MFFDSNVHLTISNKYEHTKNKFENINEKFYKILKLYKLKGFACVGLADKGAYKHNVFFKKFKGKNIIPIAALNLNNDIELEIKKIKTLGFQGLKIHPRTFNKTLENLDLDKIFFYSNKYDLRVLLCTYFNNIPKYFYSSDPKYIFQKNYKKYPNLKILLMHGGCERIMEFAEMSRFSKNLYLDLSLTLMKYDKSSVDNDLKYLFNNFDQKIVLGSDYPEVNYNLFVKKIKNFSKNLDNLKKQKIFYKNIYNFYHQN